jgi:glycosyltransferase involved in cell wall biosynthesis
MKVTIVNTHSNRGGAARAAYRLHNGLKRIGQESTMYVQQGAGENIVAYEPKISPKRPSLASRIWRKAFPALRPLSLSNYAATRPPGLEIFSDSYSPFGMDILRSFPACDVINLHWVAGFVDYSLLPKLAQKPIVWTLHDMNPFTGGCHYDDGCLKHQRSCGACPQLGSQTDSDLSRKVFLKKQAAFRQLDPARFHVVTPSRWLAEEGARSSLMKRFPFTVIPNGLNTDTFAPRNTEGLRDALSIPADNKVVLFIADSIVNKRKGMQYLLDALSALNDPGKVTLLSVGRGSTEIPAVFHHVPLGSIEDERLLSMIYSLADVFAIPSMQDNLPNTVLESISCGTPVVGFNTGGIPDMVRDGETGLLAKQGDVNGLRTAIEGMLSNADLRQTMSRNCRALALQEYSEDVQAKRYVSLYESLM